MTKKTTISDSNSGNMHSVLCENMSFAVAEANKLLRTNLMFTIGETQKCKMIGITSATRSEGKSSAAINLAYTFAETGKNVLLIDADLRKPTVAKKLGIRSTPGLSNKLAGMVSGNEILTKYKADSTLYIIPSGDVPPNPSELLSSDAMYKMLELLATKFDYIVIDLPPVNIVSDALAISKWIDGLVIVVRENQSTKKEISTCIDQLRLVESKILGFVMTDVSVSGGKYGKAYGYGYGKASTKW